ncbi:lamin tail domain-containing protein [Fodinibius halophilus]|uniref:T9SS type A sorting domain-containing protein n=1 Tax=Fodinibius halophilus TaxID=1736908 RepID=A0A6M1T2I7_9BACT|nr:lamin tail domain-containing protein [Fodinibius halophilus]NGP86833.1 T9SS type A sorting domain-containing protein [Fodinibius halophilus]
MAPRLLFEVKFKAILFSVFLVLGGLQVGYGQSLTAGDVAFTGFNADSPDGFAVVVFKNIAAGEEIHFSEGPWEGSAFDSNAGDLTWVAPSGGISAGTVLAFSDVNSTPSVNTGTITDDSNINLSGSSSVIYAYTGSDKDTPDTILAAAANSVDEYNGTEGTLTGTGLSQNDEAILLSDAVDVHEYIGDRSGNTPIGYLSQLNDNAKWQEENGSGSQASQVLPFNTEPFTIVSAPTIAFSSDKASGTEGGTASITVKLLESNGLAVDVEVKFLSTASTADVSDIDNYANTTVSFGAGAADGTTQDVSITLSDDSDFEGSEKAVFELSNNTGGAIIKPGVLTLTIEDNDAAKVVINEFLADPPSGSAGDANGDGTRDTYDDEFVEIVNSETKDIDISGWQLSDDGGSSKTYTFPEGTVLSAGRAIVVFGGGSPSGQFGSALVHAASSLSLSNSSGQVTLLDASGTIVDNFSYGSEAGEDESLTRDPDVSGALGSKHAGVSGSGGAPFSPGTEVDGSSFGTGHAIAIRGSEGWRMISSPVQGASFDTMIGDFWVQGLSGSDDPSGSETVFSWTESSGGAFSAPSGMSSTLEAGKGYIIYVFEDDEFSTSGIQGGFPKIIKSTNTENSGTVNVPVSSNDANGVNGIDENEGWNLLGNPFDADISVDALFTALETAGTVNANIYVWDNDNSGGADYVELSKGDGELLAPYQAFWVRYTQSGIDTDVAFDRDDLIANTGTAFYKETAEPSFRFALKLHAGQKHDAYQLEFNENGAIDLDRFDGYHLFSLDPSSINIFSTLNNNRLQKNVLPANLDVTVEIPLQFQVGSINELVFKWGDLQGAPKDWEFVLVDKTTNREINLRTSNKYEFKNYTEGQPQKTNGNRQLLNKGKGEADSDTRFVLSVRPNPNELSSDEIPNSAKLNPNYPNPFNPTTTISYELAKDMEVTLTVWNMIGQKVATLVDGPVEAGEKEVTWNASNMPSGIYIARFEVGGAVYTRKMTLIK